MTTSRLESIPRTDLLEGKRIIVTGCGYNPVGKIFYALDGVTETHDSITVDGIEKKLNIGAAAAYVFAANGGTVHMISRNCDKLNDLTKDILKRFNFDDPFKHVVYSPIDVLDERSAQHLVEDLPRDKPIYWFNSIGLGAGSYQLKDDNPYLHIEDIPLELLEQETRTVLRGTHNLLKKLLPVFREQRKRGISENRIAIVSSMSAIRGYSRGGAHCAAKGAISRYTNSAMFDLGGKGILVTDIRPGAIDTGMYDNPEVQKAVCEISDEYGGKYRERFALAPPISVGYVALLAFTLPAHMTSTNLVAIGQWPNEGS